MASEFSDPGGDPTTSAVRVFCRVRPLGAGSDGGAHAGAGAGLTSAGDDPSVVLRVARNGRTVLAGPAGGAQRSFTYDAAFDQDATQATVFQEVGRPITQSCLAGYNGTVFAYGQTGSGKTHTILGPTDVDEGDAEAMAQRGLVPRVLEYIFDSIAERCAANELAGGEAGSSIQFLCRASFLEIYNERVYDLLDPSAAGLQVREDIHRGVYVEGLAEETVEGADHAVEAMLRGATNRRVGSTAMNRESSRSHSVFTVTIEASETDASGLKRSRHARFSLVDLAGSERQKSTTATGARLKEASNINKSLSALGNVIHALADQAAGRQRHVHYRDSKLTFLLRDSLGGNSRTFVVATVSPAARSFDESLSTLKFARSAKKIKNVAVVNEATSGDLARLQAEITALRVQLHEANALAVARPLSGLAPSSPVMPTQADRARIGFDLSQRLRASGLQLESASAAALLDGTATDAAREVAASGLCGRGAANEDREAALAAMVVDMDLVLCDALERVGDAERRAAATRKQRQSLEAANDNLQKQVAALKKREQTSKMIIKFRDSALKRKRGPGLVSEIEAGLRQEIALLRRNEEHHPDVLHWALRAQQLEERVAELELEKEQGQWRGGAEGNGDNGSIDGGDGATAAAPAPHEEELRRVREVRDALGRRVAILVEERHALLDEVAALQAVGMAPITPGSLRGSPGAAAVGATPASDAPSPASRVQRSGQATGSEASPASADGQASPAPTRPSRSPSVASPIQSPAPAPDAPTPGSVQGATNGAATPTGPVTPLPTTAMGSGAASAAATGSATGQPSPAPRSGPPRSVRMRSLGTASTPAQASPAGLPGSAHSYASAGSHHSAGTHASRASGASSVASLPLRRQVLMHARVPGSAGPSAAWRQSPFTTPARQRRQLLDVELAKGRYEEQLAALRKQLASSELARVQLEAKLRVTKADAETQATPAPTPEAEPTTAAVDEEASSAAEEKADEASAAAQATIADLEERLARSASEAVQLAERVAAAEAAVDEAKAAAATAEEAGAASALALAQNQALVKLLETENEAWRQQLDDANVTLNSRRRSLETARRDRDREAEVRRALDARVAKAEGQVAKLAREARRARGDAERAKFELVMAQEDLDSSLATTATLKHCLAEAEAKAAKVEAQLAATQEEAAAQRASLEAQLQAAQRALGEGESERQAVVTGLQRALEESKTHARKALAEAEASVKQHADAAARSAAEAAAAIASAADMSKRVAAAKLEVAELRSAAEDAAAAQAYAQETAKALEERVAAAQAAAAASDSAAAQARVDATAAVRRAEAAEAAAAVAESHASKLDTTMSATAAELEAVTRARDEEAVLLRTAQSEAESMVAARNELASQLQAALAAGEAAAEARDAAVAKAAASVAAGGDAAEREAREAAARADAERASKVAAEAQTALVKVQTQLKDAQRRASEAEAAAAEAASASVAAGADLATVQERLDARTTEAEQLSAKVAALELQLQKLHGHANHQQKIKGYMQMKRDYNELKGKHERVVEDNYQLRRKLQVVTAGTAAPSATLRARGGKGRGRRPAVDPAAPPPLPAATGAAGPLEGSATLKENAPPLAATAAPCGATDRDAPADGAGAENDVTSATS